MGAVDPRDTARLLAQVETSVPMIHPAPQGWQGNIELALIDTVLSIRARYGVSAHTGVRGAVARYQAASGRSAWDDMRVLADVEPEWLQDVLANKQKTGGVSKASAIVGAAARLNAAGVVHAADLDRDSVEQRAAYCGTRGLGPVTWAYFLMLVGSDGVKPDTLLTRFVDSALGRRVTPAEVVDVVSAAAGRLDIPAAALDHSIWRFMSAPRRS